MVNNRLFTKKDFQNTPASYVQEGFYITIRYSFCDEQGTILGGSQENGEFVFKCGNGDALPGLETRLIGHPKGKKLQFSVPQDEAYGAYDENLSRVLPLSVLPKGLRIEQGTSLTINGNQVVVTNITQEQFTVDGNHPLSGKNLSFDVEIVDVSDIPPETYASGCACASESGCGCADDNSCDCSDKN